MLKFLNKAKSKMEIFQQSNQPASNTPPIPVSKSHKRYGPSARIAWPPIVESIDILGEVKDTNGRKIQRDLGRSITLGGKHFYMFADTFCFDDAGEFVGLISNTCAYIPDTKEPTKCSYWNTKPKEPEFIPMTNEDKEYNRREKDTDKRVANWAFGGVIEDGLDEAGKGGSGTGWIFNDRVLIKDRDSVGMELVRVELDGDKIHAKKIPGMSPFGENDLRVGSMDTFIDGSWVYLLGGVKAELCESNWPRNVLARIQYGDDLSQKTNYQYHTIAGGWQKDFSKVDDLTDVLSGIGHGMIFKVGDHGPQGKPYMCIGVDKFLSNHLHLGVAASPEGPWELKDMGELPKFLGDQSNHRYCLYMHCWGSELAQGELLISWSDDGVMGGLVAAGKLRLGMEDKI